MAEGSQPLVVMDKVEITGNIWKCEGSQGCGVKGFGGTVKGGYCGLRGR